MRECPVCHSSRFYPVRMRCTDCHIKVSGQLHLPPLARLGADHQLLATQLVLHGGNLKTLAAELDITYPTLRKRLDQTIEALKSLLEEDQSQIADLLAHIESLEISSEEGIRRIREIQNEL